MTNQNNGGSKSAGQPGDPPEPIFVWNKKKIRLLLVLLLVVFTVTSCSKVSEYSGPVFVYWYACVVAWLATMANSDSLPKIAARATGTTAIAITPVLLFLVKFNSTPANERYESTLIASWEKFLLWMNSVLAPISSMDPFVFTVTVVGVSVVSFALGDTNIQKGFIHLKSGIDITAFFVIVASSLTFFSSIPYSHWDTNLERRYYVALRKQWDYVGTELLVRSIEKKLEGASAETWPQLVEFHERIDRQLATLREQRYRYSGVDWELVSEDIRYHLKDTPISRSYWGKPTLQDVAAVKAALGIAPTIKPQEITSQHFEVPRNSSNRAHRVSLEELHEKEADAENDRIRTEVLREGVVALFSENMASLSLTAFSGDRLTEAFLGSLVAGVSENLAQALTKIFPFDTLKKQSTDQLIQTLKRASSQKFIVPEDKLTKILFPDVGPDAYSGVGRSSDRWFSRAQERINEQGRRTVESRRVRGR